MYICMYVCMYVCMDLRIGFLSWNREYPEEDVLIKQRTKKNNTTTTARRRDDLHMYICTRDLDLV